MEPKLEAEKEQKRIVDSLNLIIQKYEKEKAQRRITDSLNQLAKLRTRCDYQINEIDDFNIRRLSGPKNIALAIIWKLNYTKKEIVNRRFSVVPVNWDV